MNGITRRKHSGAGELTWKIILVQTEDAANGCESSMRTRREQSGLCWRTGEGGSSGKVDRKGDVSRD